MPKFRYKQQKKQKFFTGGVDTSRPDDEGLTGFVDNVPASEPEERAHRAVRRIVRVGTLVQVDIPGAIPGQEKQLDMLVLTIPPTPVNVNGEWVHQGSAKRGQDALRNAIIDAYGSKVGWNPVQDWSSDDLTSKEQAERKARELL